MHMMSIFCLAAHTVSSGSWFIVFNALTWKVAMLTMLLHQSKLGLSSVADFSNSRARALTSVEHTLCFCKELCGLDV